MQIGRASSRALIETGLACLKTCDQNNNDLVFNWLIPFASIDSIERCSSFIDTGNLLELEVSKRVKSSSCEILIDALDFPPARAVIATLKLRG